MWRKYCNGKGIFSFIFFIILLIGLGYCFVMPMWKQTASLQQQTAELNAKLQNVQAFMVRHANLPEYEGTIKKQLMQVNRHLPDSLELSAVLQGIEQASAGCGVNITALEPQEQKQQSLYMEIPLRLRVTSDYSQLLAFVKTMEALACFNRVEVVKIKSENMSLQSELVVRYFIFKPVGESTEMSDRGGV